MESSAVIGTNLLNIRTRKGETQEQVADSVGISYVSLSRYETGQRMPKMNILARLADHFGVTVDELLGRDGGEEKTKTEPRTIEARIVSAGMDRMSQADREFALEMFRRAFASIYDPKEGDENET